MGIRFPWGADCHGLLCKPRNDIQNKHLYGRNELAFFKKNPARRVAPGLIGIENYTPALAQRIFSSLLMF